MELNEQWALIRIPKIVPLNFLVVVTSLNFIILFQPKFESTLNMSMFCLMPIYLSLFVYIWIHSEQSKIEFTSTHEEVVLKTPNCHFDRYE